MGSTDTVVCLASGEWSPSQPICTVDDKNNPAGLGGGSSGMISVIICMCWIELVDVNINQ